MKLVILAGGKGTRLGLSHIPKPMVEIGGKPLLQHQIELAKRYGIKDIILLTGHLSHVIFDYFKDGHWLGVRITHIIEPYPLGTAGALKLVEPIINEKRFLLFYGDVMMDFDINALLRYDRKKGGIATLVIHPNDHPYDSDLLDIDEDGFIKGFYPTPRDNKNYYRNLVNAAVYVLSKRIFSFIEFGKFMDFGKELFPKLLSMKEKIAGYRTSEYIKDVGTKKRLEEVKSDYESGKVAGWNRIFKRKAVFLDRDGVINEEVNLLHRIEDFKLIPRTAEAIRELNKSGYLAVVVTNQPVIAKNLCTLEELNEIHKKMETLIGEKGAYLDGIYFCPHHPESGYPGENPLYKIRCRCRKPDVGLLKKAIKELNIEIKGSYMIGDSERDIICGKRMGLTTVALRTGYGAKSSKVEADYIFEDLWEAVNFITKEPYKKWFEVIKSKLMSLDSKPLIVLVGGNSRAGKTTFCKYVQQKFWEEGVAAQHICLDNWLVPIHERREEMNVFERFQIDKIEEDFKRFFNGERLRLKKYNPLKRAKSEEEVIYYFDRSDILLIDGVVSLAVSFLKNSSHLRVFFHIDEQRWKERFFNFYRWKGLSEIEIEELYRKRKKDEFELINCYKECSDIIIEG